MGRGGAILTHNELVLTFRGSYVCANFGENRSRNATVRVLADGLTMFIVQTDQKIYRPIIHLPGIYNSPAVTDKTNTQTDTQTDANRFYNLSHAICYSYGTDSHLKRILLHYWVAYVETRNRGAKPTAKIDAVVIKVHDRHVEFIRPTAVDHHHHHHHHHQIL